MFCLFFLITPRSYNNVLLKKIKNENLCSNDVVSKMRTQIRRTGEAEKWRTIYIQVSVRFGMYRFQISNSGDRTAPASRFPSCFNRRHRLHRSVAMAVWDDRHRSIGSVPVTFYSPLPRPPTTHIQPLQPKNSTPFAVNLMKPMATESSIKTQHTHHTHKPTDIFHHAHHTYKPIDTLFLRPPICHKLPACRTGA